MSAFSRYELAGSPTISGLASTPFQPRPPSDGEILVRVEASSLNFHDYLVVKGLIGALPGRVPLSDGVGVVEACGSNAASRFAPGDRVMGTFFADWRTGDPNAARVSQMRGEHVDGFAATHVTMPADAFTKAPAELTPLEAATLPCAGVTAWRAVISECRVRPGDTVLVQGSGGVSLFALQFAKMAGARVIAATSSPAKAEKLEALGASDVVDRTQPQWGALVRDICPGGVSHLIEVAGGDLSQSLQSMRVGGTMCLVGALSRKPIQFPAGQIILPNIQIKGITVGSSQQQEEMVSAIDLHGLRPAIDSVYPLSRLSEAFGYFETQQHFGKIVIDCA